MDETVVFRMGGENLAVAQNTYAVGWFHGRELNLVFGLQLSFSRVVHNFCFFLYFRGGLQITIHTYKHLIMHTVVKRKA